MASCLPLFILFLLTIFVKLFLFFILTPSFYILAQLLQAFRSYQEDPTIHVAIIGTTFASFQKPLQFMGPF